jgi:hypothetical protein
MDQTPINDRFWGVKQTSKSEKLMTAYDPSGHSRGGHKTKSPGRCQGSRLVGFQINAIATRLSRDLPSLRSYYFAMQSLTNARRSFPESFWSFACFLQAAVFFFSASLSALEGYFGMPKVTLPGAVA